MRVFKGMFRWIVNPISNPFQSAASYYSVIPIPLNAFPAIISLLRAHIYTQIISWKNRSFVHSRYLTVWFSSVFGVKVWVSEPFTSPPRVKDWGCRKYKRQMNCWGTLNGADSTMVRGDKRVTGMLFCIKRCYTVCEGFVNAVWTLWMLRRVQPFTPETYENQWKSGFLWRCEHFFGAKNTYICARRGG